MRLQPTILFWGLVANLVPGVDLGAVKACCMVLPCWAPGLDGILPGRSRCPEPGAGSPTSVGKAWSAQHMQDAGHSEIEATAAWKPFTEQRQSRRLLVLERHFDVA